ncbi:MAG: hypothetical protein A2138_04345 [Deltaproteobacteria bacterium RBG_16_71_12]|nr:MAG: hypothetical protein A2138_04345 [Deltaproteobacteria bacterium RBG_16_71_12]
MLFALSDHGAEFVVVGAHALALHGHPRATGDLDILVRPSTENAEKVWRALVAFGAPLFDLNREDLATAGVVFQMGLPPRRIDLLTSISGVSYDDAAGSRVDHMIEGRPIPFIGREALIANKRAAGRLKDLADVHALEHGEE